MRIFLDACIIIYWVECAQPFHAKLLAQLASIAEQHPKHLLTISRLSLLECLVKPPAPSRKIYIKNLSRFFESPFVIYRGD